jgi:hypothetical protein
VLGCGHCRGIALLRGCLGGGRRWYGRRLSVGTRHRCLGRGFLSWLFGLRGCWSATAVRFGCCRRDAGREREHQGGYGEQGNHQYGARPSSGNCHLLFVPSRGCLYLETSKGARPQHPGGCQRWPSTAQVPSWNGVLSALHAARLAYRLPDTRRIATGCSHRPIAHPSRSGNRYSPTNHSTSSRCRALSPKQPIPDG